MRKAILFFLLINLVLGALFRLGALALMPQFFKTINSGRDNLQGLPTGKEKETLDAARDRLKSLVAIRGDAPKNNNGLNVIVLNSRGAPLDKVTLDLAGLGDAGTLFIFDGPLTFNLRNVPAAAHAKLAFESGSVFSVEGAPPGLLAGFRSAAFGFENLARPADYIALTGGGAPLHFCDAIVYWAGAFGARSNEARIYLYDLAPEFQINGNHITATGLAERWAQPVAPLCFPSQTAGVNNNKRGGVTIHIQR